MKRNLKSIAMQLSDTELEELIRLRKTEGRKIDALRKKRDKLAAQLARLDLQIARMAGEAEEVQPRRRGRPPMAQNKKTALKKAAPAKKRRKRGAGVTATIRDILANANEPLKAGQIVDAFPDAGIKVKDAADMRKRVSVVLASQKKVFEQVGRGLYQLKG